MSKIRIIVLHGWNQDKKFWQEFQSRFADGEVIVFDLPGFGDEQLADEDWGVPEYAAWTRQKIEGLREKDVVLLGHSFGGRVAAYIASQQPAWLKGLVLYGAPTLYRPGATTRLRIAAAKILKQFGFRGPGRAGSSELQEAEGKHMGKIFRRIVTFDQTDFLPKIVVSTLILWGRHDRDVPLRIAEEMHRLIPESKLAVMDNVGHNAHLENNNLFYGTVKKFIDNL